MDAHLVAKEIDVSILKIVTRIQFIYICDLKHLNLKKKKLILIYFFWNSLLNYLNLKKN
jgi:hypothetical protein